MWHASRLLNGYRAIVPNGGGQQFCARPCAILPLHHGQHFCARFKVKALTNRNGPKIAHFSDGCVHENECDEHGKSDRGDQHSEQ